MSLRKSYKETEKYMKEEAYEEEDSMKVIKDFMIGVVLIGLALLLIFNATTVSITPYSYRIGGGVSIPAGATVLPLLLGVGYKFYNPDSFLGNLIMIIGVLFIVVTLILSIRISLAQTSMLIFIGMFGSFTVGCAYLLRATFPKKKKK